jgi:hypothetical protein
MWAIEICAAFVIGVFVGFCCGVFVVEKIK